MSTEYAKSYDASADTSSPEYYAAGSSQNSGLIDRQYFRGIPGFLKYGEMVFSLIGFICVTASLTVCVPWVATTGYFNFITMAAFVTTLILYFIFLFKLQTRIFRCGCIYWPVVELAYYCGIVLLLFFGDLFISLHSCHVGHQAGAAFGWFAWFCYCADLIFAGVAFSKSRQNQQQQQQQTQTQTNFSSFTTSNRY